MLTPLHKSGGILYSKRLQADVLSTFPYFGVKPFAAYRMRADIPKPSAGRRFEHFPYFGFKLVAAYRKHADTPKPSAGRRFEGRCLRQRSPSGPPRMLPRHAFSLLTARGAPGGAGFTSPKSFSKGFKFLLYTDVRGSGWVFLSLIAQTILQADVLELTPLRSPTSANSHSYA